MDDAASSLAELEEDDVGADRSDESDGVARAVPRDVRGSKEVDLADADGGAVDVEDPVVRQAVERSSTGGRSSRSSSDEVSCAM